MSTTDAAGGTPRPSRRTSPTRSRTSGRAPAPAAPPTSVVTGAASRALVDAVAYSLGWLDARAREDVGGGRRCAERLREALDRWGALHGAAHRVVPAVRVARAYLLSGDLELARLALLDARDALG